jgi:hypothetical protein
VGLDPATGRRAMIELPHGFLQVLFAALVAAAQYRRMRRS